MIICLLNFQQLHKNLLSDLVQLPNKSGPAIRILLSGRVCYFTHGGNSFSFVFLTSNTKTGLRRVLFFRYSLISVLYCLFSLIHTVQERNNLCTGTVVMRTEQTVSDAIGDALLLCPCCRIGIVCIGRYIGESRATADRRTACRTVQERCALCSRADGAGCKRCIARALGNAILNRPRNCLGVVCICRNIREAAQRLRLRRTCRTPQEGYDLRSGAGSVRSKQRVAHTSGNALVLPPT